MSSTTLTFSFLMLVLCCHFCTSVGNQCEMAQVCVTDLTDCPAGQYLQPWSRVNNCCPSCVDGTAPPGVCAPPSNCLPDGRFAPVQCKGDLFTGRCFCSDENGNRIFGQMWRDEANEMTCACSRRRSELLSLGRGDVSVHCTRNGDYEPLQCDSGLCWCVQPRTGQPTVSPVPEPDMTRLPCYNSAAMGEQYLRRCESIVHALAVIHREQSEHGTNFVSSAVNFCDYDGSYGPFQIQNTQVYCTGRDRSILGAWQVDITNMAGMNCNCARDTVMYFPERGMTVSAVCRENGNYRANQVAGDQYYCVDSDGYQVGPFMPEWPEDLCASVA